MEIRCYACGNTRLLYLCKQLEGIQCKKNIPNNCILGYVQDVMGCELRSDHFHQNF